MVMKTRRFTVKSHPYGAKYPHWFYLYVYPTREELRRAAGRYSADGSYAAGDDTVGCFQPLFRFYVDGDGSLRHTRNTSFIGVMRLNLQDFQPHVIIHESVHAAVALAGNDTLTFLTPLDAHNCEIQELIAHATHDISWQLLKLFRMIP